MEKDLLKKIILEQNNYDKEIIFREDFKKTDNFKKNDFVIIISGIRRCGKSTFLQYIRKQYSQNNFYLNFDDERLKDFKLEDFQTLVELFIEIYGNQNTFFFDEIQNIIGWERFIRRLHNENKKVYVTGSNATMLSKELGTHLTGRNIEIKLFPFSFKDYLTFKNFKIEKNDFHITEKKSLIKKHFNEYLILGGIPEYLKTKEKDYLKSLYDNIVYRDVLARYNLSNERTLKDLIYYLVSNITCEISYNSIKNLLGLSNPVTVKEYMNYFQNSYLIFTLNRFNYSLKKQIYSNKKTYFIDNGFANTISFKFSEDYGKLIENLVFLELKRKNLDIYFHREKNECDFIIRNGYEISYSIQVTKSLESTKTKEREITGLIDALKTYKLKEGLILTEDEEDEFEVDGFKIIVKPIWKWLLE